MLLLMMAASLASLLISVQETLYAVKVVSIDSLLTTPFSNCLIKWCMAYNSQDAAIFQCLTARSMFPELPSIGADAAGLIGRDESSRPEHASCEVRQVRPPTMGWSSISFHLFVN